MSEALAPLRGVSPILLLERNCGWPVLNAKARDQPFLLTGEM